MLFPSHRRATKALYRAAGILLFLLACIVPSAYATPHPVFLVRDINPIHTPGGPWHSDPNTFVPFNGTLYFTTFIPDQIGITKALWQSNGTASSTYPVEVEGLRDGSWLTPTSNKLFFVTNGALWQSDGSSAGTSQITNSLAVSAPSSLIAANEKLFFLAGRGQSATHDLWTSDGTSVGTIPLTQFTGETATQLTPVGSHLFFLVNSALSGSSEKTLWVSDGTAAGTIALPFQTDKNVVLIDGDSRVYMLFFNPDQFELWSSDGTIAGTAKHTQIDPANEPPTLAGGAVMNNRLFFILGCTLWRYEVGMSTAIPVRTFHPPPPGHAPIPPDCPDTIRATAERIFFIANDGSSGRQLWSSDGTTAATIRLTSGTNSMDNFNIIDNALFFRKSDGIPGLWKSDGTLDGTALVDDAIFPSNAIAAAGDYIFLSASNYEVGLELFAITRGSDAYLEAPPIVHAGNWAGIPGTWYDVRIPLTWGNLGLQTTEGLTITATLSSQLGYVDDTALVRPLIDGQTLTWHLLPQSLGEEESMSLRLFMNDAPIGTTFPVTFTLTTHSTDTHPANNQRQMTVMVGDQVHLPLVTNPDPL